MVKIRHLGFFALLLCCVLNSQAQYGPPPGDPAPVPGADQDPPSRAARLSYSNGAVSMEPAGMNDWAPVEVNRPFTAGDYLYTDQKSVAELQLDSAVFRMGEVTSFGFLNLNDQIAQLKLTEGDLYFRLHDLAPSQTYEIDTPNAAISLLRNGVYRIHVDPDANTTYIVVREGQAEITGGGEAFSLNPGQSANLSGSGQLAYDIEQAPAPDVLDQWCMERDEREMLPAATQYVPPSMIGYSDLNQYGTWTQAPDYGPVWYPTEVPAGWAPYHMGHWVWIDPWGWTWVDAAPWAFAPCHYGRWVYWHDRWGWAPGPVAVAYAQPVRPIYAPALVAWFGGAHWGVSIGFGGGPAFGWVALGFGEVYTPAYHVSPGYFRNVNVYNTRIVNNVNITNVYKTVYVNKTVYNQTFINARAPQGVVGMSASAMAAGRPVQQVAQSIPPAAFARAQSAPVIAPAVVPTRTAVAPLLGGAAPHPNQAVFARPVVAHAAAPARVIPFEQRQAFIQQHQGEPLNTAAMRQQFQAQARPVAQARVVQQSRPVQVQPGQRVGNVPPAPAFARANATSAPAPQAPAQHGVPPNRQNGNNVVARQTTTQQQPNRSYTDVQGDREATPNRTYTPQQERPSQPNVAARPEQERSAGRYEAPRPATSVARPANQAPRNLEREHPSPYQPRSEEHRSDSQHHSESHGGGGEHKSDEHKK